MSSQDSGANVQKLNRIPISPGWRRRPPLYAVGGALSGVCVN